MIILYGTIEYQQRIQEAGSASEHAIPFTNMDSGYPQERALASVVKGSRITLWALYSCSNSLEQSWQLKLKRASHSDQLDDTHRGAARQ